jgi:hypothetical protein
MTITSASGENDHPRLFLDSKDVAAFRRRAADEPFASVAKSIEQQLADPSHAGTMYDDRVTDLATLYLATGEREHAIDAEKLAVAMVNDRSFWNNPRSKGLTRAAGARRVAIAYDLCYDAWSPETRTLVSGKLRAIADGMMKSMGAEANVQLANNWQAVRYGGSGLAYLACDEPDSAAKAKDAYTRLKRHLQANLGSNGWNPEGIGYTQYPWQFTGPFGIAAFRAGLGDLREEVKPARLTHWTTLAGTVAIPRVKGVGLRADFSDDHPSWSGDGTAALAFWYAPSDQTPAIRWMYDYLCGSAGDRSFDARNAGGLYSLLLYPAGLEPKNPATVPSAGLNYTDASHGLALFRNRFKDEDDIVAAVNAHSRQPAGCHGGPDTNSFRIMGLGGCWVVGSGRTSDPSGQTNLFPGDPTPLRRGDGGLGKLEHIAFTPDGGGSAIASGSCLGVKNHRRQFVADYAGKAGAPAVFRLRETSDNGKVWRLNTPEFNQIAETPQGFTLTGPNGATLAATVLSPAKPTFRTGTFERGGGSGHTGFPYRGTKYINNRWIEFDCTGEVELVMTLQPRQQQPPRVVQEGDTIKVGGVSIELPAMLK